MKIGYKRYFMSEKLRKIQVIYPFFFSYYRILLPLRDQSFIDAKYYSSVAQPRQIGRLSPVFWFFFLSPEILGVVT